jgi:hypothetical protein
MPPYDGSPCISLDIPCFKGAFVLYKICFQFWWLVYVQWHQLPVTPSISNLVLGHHVETTEILRSERSDVPQN